MKLRTQYDVTARLSSVYETPDKRPARLSSVYETSDIRPDTVQNTM